MISGLYVPKLYPFIIMPVSRIISFFIVSFNKRPLVYVLIVTMVNFILRLVVYYNTVLFRFGDFGTYLKGVDRLLAGKQQDILDGNFLFGISYLGFFFEKCFGSIDAFFVFNSLIGALTTITIFFLVYNVTKNALAGFISVVLLTIYTEYMVFSSVFYSTVMMCFVVSLIIFYLYKYLKEEKFLNMFFIAAGIIILFISTFFFRPELKYLPWLLILFSAIMSVKHKSTAVRTGIMAIIMVVAYICVNNFGVITKKDGHMLANDFVFFGHTDYGGDGGEGAFIYDENRERYEKALFEYRKDNEFIENDRVSINKFQRDEIIRFVTQNPFGWIKIQFIKFFRTFGVVPEGASFKILCSGLLKNKIWLTSFIIVMPVVLFVVMFIFLYDGDAIKRLYSNRTEILPFLILFVLLFGYYLVASIFYGHYQERYRIPILVLFVIPAISYFLANLKTKEFIKKSIYIKGTILAIFIVVWIGQIVRQLSNKERIGNVIELIDNIQDKQ